MTPQRIDMLRHSDVLQLICENGVYCLVSPSAVSLQLSTMGAGASVTAYRAYIRENFFLWKVSLETKPYLSGGRGARTLTRKGYHAVSRDGRTDVYHMETGELVSSYERFEL